MQASNPCSVGVIENFSCWVGMFGLSIPIGCKEKIPKIIHDYSNMEYSQREHPSSRLPNMTDTILSVHKNKPMAMQLE